MATKDLGPMSATVALGQPVTKASSSMSTCLHASGVATRIVGQLNMNARYTPVRPNRRM
uniref:D3 n=1 Tax=Arundo donax TaxID=35708 RepID=A0A0A9DSL5_ARUDO